MFGVYDLSGTPSQLRQGMTSFRDLYLPDHDVAARKDPDVSPLYADLANLPPAYVSTMEFDPLRDEGIEYALRAADLAEMHGEAARAESARELAR